MALTRKLIAHDENEDNQWLSVDARKRYIQNTSDCWQFLFGPNSRLTSSTYSLKVAAEFNKTTLDTLRITGYLYNQVGGTVGVGSTCTFDVYLVNSPNWTEQLIHSVIATPTANSYFFSDIPTSLLTGVDLFGGDTLMIEVLILRLNESYRERIYINHLGIYDNTRRLRNDVDWLDISKLDE